MRCVVLRMTCIREGCVSVYQVCCDDNCERSGQFDSGAVQDIVCRSCTIGMHYSGECCHHFLLLSLKMLIFICRFVDFDFTSHAPVR